MMRLIGYSLYSAMIIGYYDDDIIIRWFFSDTRQFQQTVHCGTKLTGSMFFLIVDNVGPILPHSWADIGPCYTPGRRFMHINLM